MKKKHVVGVRSVYVENYEVEVETIEEALEKVERNLGDEDIVKPFGEEIEFSHFLDKIEWVVFEHKEKP